MSQRKTRKSRKFTRRTYNDEYRAEALKLADSVGATEAARQLGIQTSQVYSWCTKVRINQSQSQVEKNLLSENAKLKRELAERNEEVTLLKKASAYFANHQK